jgi:hypothetical protein
MFVVRWVLNNKCALYAGVTLYLQCLTGRNTVLSEGCYISVMPKGYYAFAESFEHKLCNLSLGAV